MNCKDCIHNDICEKLRPIEWCTGKTCLGFKNKANFVELPCIAMVEQCIKDGKFNKKNTTHNGKYAVVYIDKSKWHIPLIDITEQFYNDEKAKERIQALKGGAKE